MKELRVNIHQIMNHLEKDSQLIKDQVLVLKSNLVVKSNCLRLKEEDKHILAIELE